eukprot:469007_1
MSQSKKVVTHAVIKTLCHENDDITLKRLKDVSKALNDDQYPDGMKTTKTWLKNYIYKHESNVFGNQTGLDLRGIITSELDKSGLGIGSEDDNIESAVDIGDPNAVVSPNIQEISDIQNENIPEKSPSSPAKKDDEWNRINDDLGFIFIDGNSISAIKEDGYNPSTIRDMIEISECHEMFQDPPFNIKPGIVKRAFINMKKKKKNIKHDKEENDIDNQNDKQGNEEEKQEAKPKWTQTEYEEASKQVDAVVFKEILECEVKETKIKKSVLRTQIKSMTNKFRRDKKRGYAFRSMGLNKTGAVHLEVLLKEWNKYLPGVMVETEEVPSEKKGRGGGRKKGVKGAAKINYISRNAIMPNYEKLNDEDKTKAAAWLKDSRQDLTNYCLARGDFAQVKQMGLIFRQS